MVWWWVAGAWLLLGLGVSLVVVRSIRLADRETGGGRADSDALATRPGAPARRRLRAEAYVSVAPRLPPGTRRRRARSATAAGTAHSTAGEPPLRS